ncbi:MAG: tRNA (adenosine(37)-N6)-threonylcarbamoyltransferase complex ATPase subunit type 1 TsaE [Agarilytica sp.]
MTDSWSIYLADAIATVGAGEALAKTLQSRRHGLVMYLEGSLGAGKTTFSRGVLQGFGHNGPVKSPTYTLVEPYDLKGQKLFHFDLYRLGDPEELEFLGIRDYFAEQYISLIEWAEKGEGYIPKPDLVLKLYVEQGGRRLCATSETERGENILAALL